MFHRRNLWCCTLIRHPGPRAPPLPLPPQQTINPLHPVLTHSSQVSPPVARLPVRLSPPRLPANLHHPPEVSRSPIVISPVPSLSVRSVATRSRPSSSSASCLSSALSVRSLRISSPTSASSHLPSELSRSLLRLTSSLFSRTPTFAPSMPSVSPSVSLSTRLIVLNFYLTRLRRIQGHPACPPSPW